MTAKLTNLWPSKRDRLTNRSTLFLAAVSGTPGSVSQSVVRSSSLDAPAKGSYPVPLLRLMKRHAEDLLRGNDLTMAKKVLKFVKLLSADRADARDIYKGTIVINKLSWLVTEIRTSLCFEFRAK